ncbi:DNA methyltransferase [Methanosarcina sp. MSH10X1]|uniref:DNA methyltransferase n=1 Tax=Methanosarcina sp. MSH10X1 TaxID=2507075 RepID=UPI0035123D77
MFENEIMFDPFMGAGTNAIATLRSNSRLVCYDISKEHCQFTRKRIRKESRVNVNLNSFH